MAEPKKAAAKAADAEATEEVVVSTTEVKETTEVEEAPKGPRLLIKNVPGFPNGYADEITASERASIKANNPDAYADLTQREKEWADAHSGKKVEPAKPTTTTDFEAYAAVSTPKKAAQAEAGGKEKREHVTIVLPPTPKDESLPTANVTVRQDGETVAKL